MIPSGIDDAKVRNQLLDEFNIEIAGGFGAVKGKIWRVGLMGYCSPEAVCAAVPGGRWKSACLDQGFRVPSGAGRGSGDSELLAGGDRWPLLADKKGRNAEARKQGSKEMG